MENLKILALMFFLLFPALVFADIRLQIIRIRGEKMQTDYQFNYALSESLQILNQVSPVPVVLKRVRAIKDPWPGAKFTASQRFHALYKFYSRRGWLTRADATATIDRPTLQKATGYPYFQGFSFTCSVFTSKAHSVSMIADKRYNGDDGLFLGVTALTHEVLHILGALHIWLADGSCNNLMHISALACSVYSVPPVTQMTYDNVRQCFNRRRR